MRFDDEILTAFTDEELSPEQAARVAHALREDPELAARAEALRQSRAAVAALPLAPAPAGLEARIRAMAAAQSAPPQDGGKIVAFAPKPRKAQIWTPAALAAALALAVGLGLGMLIPRPAPPVADSGFDAQTVALLDGSPSGRIWSEGGRRMEVVSSFHDGAGAFCREFEESRAGRAQIVVACRSGAAWETRLAVMTSAAAGYEPVSALEPVEAWMRGADASAPLSLEAEAQQLK